MPKIPNPFDKPKGKIGKKKPPPFPKDPKPYGNYGQGRNMPSNKLPPPPPQRKKKPPTKYYGYGNKPAPYGKKKLGAGVDTRPTERDSQIRKSQYGPPRTARDIELAPRPRPRPKNPKRPTPQLGYQPYQKRKPELERRKRKILAGFKPKKGM